MSREGKRAIGKQGERRRREGKRNNLGLGYGMYKKYSDGLGGKRCREVVQKHKHIHFIC